MHTSIKNIGFNPYLPSWEYVPDGEPHVFDDRVYIYGSHDKFNGHVFCLNDYVCWSAPVDDLRQWRYEGEIYKKSDDPLNPDGRMCLYAPDVAKGTDGRYYLYYVLDKASVVSVAVCATPAGKYEFYGYVQYPDGSRYGERFGDEPQFDPGVLTEGKITYLYTGFCGKGDTSRSGALGVALAADMLTITDGPYTVVPGTCYGEGTEFAGHEYFEAASIRKLGDTYYLVYSSAPMHELCYATSKNPLRDFKYGGVIISNCDMHIGSYKHAGKPTNFTANNHGSIEEINNQWYIFYHRHTNGTWYSRQACLEKIDINGDGYIAQVCMTSQGGNGGPLPGCGEYPAYIACNVFRADDKDGPYPRITQDGKDGDEEQGYIADISDLAVIGFKFFDCTGIKSVKVKTRGYCNGLFEVSTSWQDKPLGEIQVEFSNIWTEFKADINIPDGVHAIFFTYKGGGSAQMASFTLDDNDS